MNGFILFIGNPSRPEVVAILNAAEKLQINLQVVDPRKITVMVNPGGNYLLIDGKTADIPDFAIAAFAEDPSYSNKACLQQLESMGVLCINSATAMQNTKDKMLTLQLLSAKGIPVSKTILYTPSLSMSVIENELGFPLVLKVIGGSKGDGVILIDNAKHLLNILRIVNAGRVQEELILQQFVSSSKGRDLRVMIVDGKAVACAQRKSASKDGFRSNVSAGGSITSYPMDKEIEDISNKTAKALGLFVGGIDLLFTDNGYVVCEANSIPGFDGPGHSDNLWEINLPKTFMESVKNALTS